MTEETQGVGGVGTAESIRQQILQQVLDGLLWVLVPLTPLLVWGVPVGRLRNFWICTAATALILGLRWLARHGVGSRIAGWSLILGLLLLFTTAATTAGGILAPVIHGYLLVIVAAGLVIHPRAGGWVAGAAILCAAGLAAAQRLGVLPAARVIHTPWSRFGVFAMYAMLFATLQSVGNRFIFRSLSELRRAYEGMEARVRQRTADLAEAREAAEAANAAKSRFLALVSHELRSPLTSIRGSLALLAGGGAGDLNDPARILVEIGERNVDRLLGLVDELLDLEKAAAGRFEVVLEDLDLAPVLRGAFAGIQGYAADRGVACVLELPEGPCPVRGDTRRLEQVCLNLLSNAVKHAVGEGPVRAGMSVDRDNVRVAVANPGEPIPEAFRPRIFQAYEQMQAGAGTTGLGLSLSKAIMEAHHGRIGFDSGPETTVFFFELPLAAPGEGPQSKEAA